MKGEKGAEEREELKKEMMRKMILGGDFWRAPEVHRQNLEGEAGREERETA